MKFYLKIEIPELPKMVNTHFSKWVVAMAHRKKWRTMVARLCINKRPPSPLTACKIVCTRHSTTKSDFDNLVISFKPLIDGLKDGKIIIDDTDAVILERYYKHEKAPRGKGRVTVEIWEL
jgi:Holliday junction resolvase RusA-like endonuclease